VHNALWDFGLPVLALTENDALSAAMRLFGIDIDLCRVTDGLELSLNLHLEAAFAQNLGHVILEFAPARRASSP
jgi:hypothetical protein